MRWMSFKKGCENGDDWLITLPKNNNHNNLMLSYYLQTLLHIYRRIVLFPNSCSKLLQPACDGANNVSTVCHLLWQLTTVIDPDFM